MATSIVPHPLYYAIDNAATIEKVAELNSPLSKLSLPNITIGSQLADKNQFGIKRRTRMHKWWDYEAMTCNVTGMISSRVGDSDLHLPHYNPDVLEWFRDQGLSGVVRGYSGFKYLEVPIVKGHTSSGYWNEDFCDDTRLLLVDCVMTDESPAGKYFDTLTALRDYYLDEKNDILGRDLAECTMLELFLEAVKQYHQVAQQYNCGTHQLLISDLVQDSQTRGWPKVISNIRNVDEAFEPKSLPHILRDASEAMVTQRGQLLLDVIRSSWYECAGAIVSLLKCRAVVSANGDLCKKMPNCVVGNQWLSVYYDCDICDEISFSEWITLCGFDASMEEHVTGDMSEYLDRKHLATDTSLIPPYKGKSYSYKGLTVSRPKQNENLQLEPKPDIDLAKEFEGDVRGRLSLCVNVQSCELVVVKRSKKERLLRFLGSFSVTLKLPVVDVTKNGSVTQGHEGPAPNVVANRIMAGKYGKEVTIWLLSHIFIGHITVRSGSPVRSFLPKHALSKDGKLTLTSPLDGSMLYHFKFMVKNDKNGKSLYWMPYKYGNVFQISVGKSMVTLSETEEDIADAATCSLVRVSSHKRIA